MKKVVPKSAVLIPDNAKRVFKGVIFDVYQWEQELFDGTKTTFEMLRRPETLVAIGVVDDKIILLDETQPQVGSFLGFPGGRLDPEDVSTLEACKREMLEETGYEFKTWKLIEVKQPHPKIEWFIYVYVATEPIGRKDVKHDPGEKIDLLLMAFEELKAECIKGSGRLDKQGKAIFENLSSISDLYDLPEFKGKEVDR